MVKAECDDDGVVGTAKLGRLLLRLDNGTLIGCCPSLGVQDGSKAVVRLFAEGCTMGSVTQNDLDRLGLYVAELDAKVKRKSDAAAAVRAFSLTTCLFNDIFVSKIIACVARRVSRLA